MERYRNPPDAARGQIVPAGANTLAVWLDSRGEHVVRVASVVAWATEPIEHEADGSVMHATLRPIWLDARGRRCVYLDDDWPDLVLDPATCGEALREKIVDAVRVTDIADLRRLARENR